MYNGRVTYDVIQLLVRFSGLPVIFLQLSSIPSRIIQEERLALHALFCVLDSITIPVSTNYRLFLRVRDVGYDREFEDHSKIRFILHLLYLESFQDQNSWIHQKPIYFSFLPHSSMKRQIWLKMTCIIYCTYCFFPDFYVFTQLILLHFTNHLHYFYENSPNFCSSTVPGTVHHSVVCVRSLLKEIPNLFRQ